MAVAEGCRRSLEISIPVHEVESETSRVTQDVLKRAKLPGFRPGKAPASIIRKQFAGDIRQRVLESLIPKYLDKQFEAENLKVVGTPDIRDVHFHDGEPLRFKAEFEVIPEIELGEYRNVEVPYQDPEVGDDDVAKRIEELRQTKAQYVNIDPRPLADGDFAVVAVESLSGVAGEPVKQDEMVLEIGGPETVQAFTDNLRGASPGDEKEFEVAYPKDYGSERLAGHSVLFRAAVKGLRRKDLPEVNDEFAQDLGDYRNVDELRDAVRKAIFAERQFEAQREAKDKIVEKLVDAHDFPVPEAFIDAADQEPRGAEPARHGGGRHRSALHQAGLGQGQGNAARQGRAGGQGVNVAFTHRRSRSHRGHARRGGSRSRTGGPSATRAGGGRADAFREGWHAGAHGLSHPALKRR